MCTGSFAQEASCFNDRNSSVENNNTSPALVPTINFFPNLEIPSDLTASLSEALQHDISTGLEEDFLEWTFKNMKRVPSEVQANKVCDLKWNTIRKMDEF